MIDSPGLLLAFLAGFVSFVSPCVLPLVPGYLATVCGADIAMRDRRLNPRVVARSLLFVASFSVIFILLGLTATALGNWLFQSRSVLNTIAGAAIIAMGIMFIASAFVLALNRDWRVASLARRAGGGGPVLAGAAFALAWTPCIGPTLGAILGLAASSEGTVHGGVLLAAYSAGLAVPFLLSAIAFNRVQAGLGWFRRHHQAIQIGSGALLVTVGLLVISGEMFQLNIEAQKLLDKFGMNFFQSV